MAKITIPTPQTRANVGRPVLVGTERTARDYDTGLTQLAQIAGSIASNVMTANNNAASQEASNNLSEWSNNALNGENGLYTQRGKNSVEASDRMMSDFDSYSSELLGTASNNVQRGDFQRMIDNQRLKLAQQSMRYQNAQMSEYRSQQQAAYLQTNQNAAANGYDDPSVVNESITNQLSSIEEFGRVNGESEEVIQANKLNATNATYSNVAKRMILNDEFDSAKTFVEDRKEDFHPNEYNRLMSSINQGFKVSAGKAKQKLNGEINDYVAYKNSGGTETINFDESNIKQIYGDEQGAQIYAEIKDAEEFSNTYNSVKFATPEEIQNMVTGEQPGPEDFRREQSQYQTLIRAVQDRNTQIMADPAAYSLQQDTVQAEYDKYVQTGNGVDYAAATTAFQNELGVPADMQTLIPKASADQMVASYMEGGQTATEMITKLKNDFGAYYPNAIRDLNKAGLPPTAQVVAIMPQGNASNLLSEAEREGFKALKETITPDVYNDNIKNAITGELEEFRNSVAMAPNGASHFLKIKSAVELLAMKYTAMGQDPGDAVEKAANDVMNNQYTFVDGYRIPTTQPAGAGQQSLNSTLIRGGVDTYMKQIKDMDLMLPSHEGMPDDVAEQEYKKNLQITPVTMNDETGIAFVNQNSNTILDANGQPLILTWDDLTLMGHQVQLSPTGTAAVGLARSPLFPFASTARLLGGE